MSIVTLLVFVVVLIAVFYLIRFIPEPTLQTVAKVIVVIGALIWLIRNMQALLHCCSS
jgi:uncharacterized membrane protein YdjX (TVP38/TMEM64 family)